MDDRTTPRCIIVRFQNTEDKEKINSSFQKSKDYMQRKHEELV
jgi:hypothetical protein